GQAHRLADARKQTLDAHWKFGANRLVKGANAALQRRQLRNHIEGRAGVQRADRYDDRLIRGELAADDALQHRDELRCGNDRIDGALRERPVAALSGQLDVEAIRRCKERAVANADLPDVQPAVEVQRKSTIDVRV